MVRRSKIARQRTQLVLVGKKGGRVHLHTILADLITFWHLFVLPVMFLLPRSQGFLRTRQRNSQQVICRTLVHSLLKVYPGQSHAQNHTSKDLTY
jgi:hypothetical protein